MRLDPQTVTVTVECESPDELRELVRIAQPKIAPDSTITATRRIFSGGTAKTEETPHRIADYFDDIRIMEVPEHRTALRLVFHRRSDAGRFWKDMMTIVLESLQSSLSGVSIKSVTRGDAAALEQAEVGPEPWRPGGPKSDGISKQIRFAYRTAISTLVFAFLLCLAVALNLLVQWFQESAPFRVPAALVLPFMAAEYLLVVVDIITYLAIVLREFWYDFGRDWYRMVSRDWYKMVKTQK